MRLKKIVCSIILILLLIAADQLTKLLVVTKMELGEEIKVFGDIIVLKYIRNTGAAWGSFSGKIPVLILVSFFVVGAICYIYFNIIDDNRFRPIRICLIFILGGAFGNMIDRIRLEYVVDFIYAKFIDFPVFNFADICVTVFTIILVLLFIFKYNSEDHDIILGSKPESEKKNIDSSVSQSESEKNTPKKSMTEILKNKQIDKSVEDTDEEDEEEEDDEDFEE